VNAKSKNRTKKSKYDIHMILLDITNKNEQKTFNIMQFGYKKQAG